MEVLDIIQSFDNLNSRITRIISSVRMHVKLSRKIKIEQFDHFCSSILYRMNKKIVSLNMSDEYSPGLIGRFNSKFSIDYFQNLKALTLNKVCGQELYSILTKLHMLKQLISLSINRDCDIRDEDNKMICQIIFSNQLKLLKYCKLPFYRSEFSEKVTKNDTLIIKKLSIGVYWFRDILLLFQHVPQIKDSRMQVCNERKSSSTRFLSNVLGNSLIGIQHLLTRFELSINNDYFSFGDIKSILKYLPQLKQFSFSALTCGFIYLFKGDSWENMLSRYTPLLEKFSFYAECRIHRMKLHDYNINTDDMLSEFKTNYYFNHGWYFICDYYATYDSNRIVSIYTIPCHGKHFAVQSDTLESSTTALLDSSFPPTVIYNKTESLHLLSKVMDNIQNRRYSAVTSLRISRSYWQIKPQPITWSDTFLTEIQQLVVCSKLRRLSLCENIDTKILIEILTRSINVHTMDIECDILSKFLLSDSTLCSLINQMIKTLNLELNDNLFKFDIVEEFCSKFSNIECLYINIDTIDEIYLILPVLLTKLTHLTYLNVYYTGMGVFHLNHNIESWLEEKTQLSKEWIIDSNDYYLAIWI
ncbi:unnamed protein product [Didymodactylos carnosus]|uniref:Uncharacterized protein n=1 Tax=Didymodactylos carnosus TaxID=1234261 RepID=A0A815BF41_9BILA|nr:unnamed protein product [Didymodactylos carnosus]CAF1268858.1 unnamed protein product [Didymodactylos carnosus]CAF3784529.1 unnamed protein product [Didymodactylos carnosus]CAF4054753.1 unnamed protein product [Didymodactylos carnosus]